MNGVQHNAFQGHRRPANQSVSIFDRCLLKKNMYHFPKKAIAGRAGSEVCSRVDLTSENDFDAISGVEPSIVLCDS